MTLPEKDEKHYVYQLAEAINQRFKTEMKTEINPVLSTSHYVALKEILDTVSDYAKDCK